MRGSKQKQCRRCKAKIAAARVRALPHATTCKKCADLLSDQIKVKGSTIYEHKTAGYIEIQSGERFKQFKRLGRHPRTAKGETGAVWRNDGTPDGTIYAGAARCHPERPRATPTGLCLECAQQWYHQRRK